MELSKEQMAFVKKCEKAGLKVRHDYSGRGMFGKTCPAVVCDLNEFPGNPHKYCIDNMGLSFVIYCR